MLRVLLQELCTARHFKIAEVEARGDRTADQSIGASVIQGRTEQPTGFDNGQQSFASLDVSSQLQGRVVASQVDHVDGQRGAVVEMPQLVLLDKMEGREICFVQKKLNSRGEMAVSRETTGQALVGNHFTSTINLPKPTAFRMWVQLQGLNPLFGIVHGFISFL
jgi:hypothetical protein